MRSRAGTAVGRLREELDRSLFLPSPGGGGPTRAWEGIAVVAAFLLLASALQLFRAGPSESLHSLWAEDGPIFLHGALTHGFFDDVASTYAEYLVVVPRLIGEIGAAVPLHAAPEVMNLSGVFVISLAGLAVWFGSAGHIHRPYLRALLVALTVLCPVSGLEAVVSGTYVAWYLSFAVFWMLLWRPATTWGACLAALLVLLTGLSSPTIFFFVPLAALRAIAIRDRRDALVVGAFAIAFLVQVPVTAQSKEEIANPTWTHDLWTTFLQRVVDGSVFGLELGGSLWEHLGWPFLIALAIGLLAYLAVLLARATSGRLLAALAIATAVVMFIVSLYQRGLGTTMVWGEGIHNGLGGRYSIVPVLLLISAAFVLLESRGRGSSPLLWPIAATALVLLVALATSFDVKTGLGRSMPPWDLSLQAAAAGCRAEGLTEAPVEVTPPGSTVAIPCDRLESEYAEAPSR